MKLKSFKIGIAIIATMALLSTGCSDQQTENTDSANASAVETKAEPVDDGKGVGPVKNVNLSESLDTALIAEGKAIFDMKCSACHDIGARKVGPAVQGVTERRKPEWVMNMIMNPSEMTQKDPTAKKLLGEYMTQMADQNVDEKSARALLEYFRSLDKK